MGRRFSVVYVSVLLMLGAFVPLVVAAPPAGAQTVIEVTRCDYLSNVGSFSGETVVHWDEALLKQIHGAGIAISEVSFSWVTPVSTLGGLGRRDGENARTETPSGALSVTATLWLTNGRFVRAFSSCHAI
jgi:hypothetical protein